MNRIRMLVIDPQNDFMDLDGAALPVGGAQADMQRLVGFMDAMSQRISELVVTLDSHASVGIERTSFWVTCEGVEVEPFTAITAAQAQRGVYAARNPALRAQAIGYLERLEAIAARTLIAWPVHCVLGTWGHNIAQPLAARIAQWERQTFGRCEKLLKGLNPMTEQYSAFRAEVPLDDDPRTGNNDALMARLAAGDELLVVAGEALSHCVAASGEDMLAQMDDARLRNTVFLVDCMSPVSGFEAQAQQFLQRLRAGGVRTMSAAQAARL